MLSRMMLKDCSSLVKAIALGQSHITGKKQHYIKESCCSYANSPLNLTENLIFF